MDDYKYDAFLSYPRRGHVVDWVGNHFFPQLKSWLSESLPDEPKIFMDAETIETGAEWPFVLRDALNRSRCLIPIFCPSYFRSRWCRSELESFRRREAVMGLRSPEKPWGLIYPVVFFDGEFFPSDVRSIQQRNLSAWALPHAAFSQTVAYSEFVAAVQSLCIDLGQLILKAPAWESTWPSISLPTPSSPQIPLPRIR